MIRLQFYQKDYRLYLLVGLIVLVLRWICLNVLDRLSYVIFSPNQTRVQLGHPLDLKVIFAQMCLTTPFILFVVWLNKM